ncbi:MAG: hypothetical protein JXR94_13200, partial [Candidatus Hydrogenedentes bacterium]|nr:hypothetical protein [Candidatus Hydrogenedentota bacterium]
MDRVDANLVTHEAVALQCLQIPVVYCRTPETIRLVRREFNQSPSRGVPGRQAGRASAFPVEMPLDDVERELDGDALEH